MLDVLSFGTFNAVEGILNSLDDDNDAIIEASLESLNGCVQHNWAEISDSLAKMLSICFDYLHLIWNVKRNSRQMLNGCF